MFLCSRKEATSSLKSEYTCALAITNMSFTARSPARGCVSFAESRVPSQLAEARGIFPHAETTQNRFEMRLPVGVFKLIPVDSRSAMV